MTIPNFVKSAVYALFGSAPKGEDRNTSRRSLSDIHAGRDIRRCGIVVIHGPDAAADFVAEVETRAEAFLAGRSAVVLDAARFFEAEFWQVPALASAHLPVIVVAHPDRLGAQGCNRLARDLKSGRYSSLPAVGLPHGEAHDLLARHSRFFYQASILISDFCNLKCRMCMFHSEDETTFHFKAERLPREKALLDLAVCARFLDQLPPGTRVLVSAAGEVFVHKQAGAILRQVSDRGLIPIVITNGQLLDEEKIDLLLDLGVRQVIVSIDSIDPANYRSIRVGGELAQVVENVERLRRRAKDAGADLTVTVNVVMFEENLRNRDAVLSFWRQRVDQLSFLAERMDHFGRPKATLTQDDPDIPHCFAPMEGPFLLADGNMAPCCSVAICNWFEPMPWLVNVEEVTVDLATVHYRQMMLDPGSPLRKLCSKCHYGANSYCHERRSPFGETFDFSQEL